MNVALDRSTLWLQEKACSAIAEAATFPFFRAQWCSCNRWSKDLPVCPMYVCVRTLSTGDTVDHTLPVVDSNQVLGMDQFLSHGPKRMEGDFNGQQAQHSAERLQPSTEVGEGQ